jgi:predicted MFS family arabinose efflux permease
VIALLRRAREFRKLWTGQTISLLGDQITAVALPLAAVLVLDASAAEVGVLVAAEWLPYLLLSLAAALWVDRRRQRRLVLVAADLARALVLLSIPVAYALDVLTIWHLVAAAFLVGTFSALFAAAYSAFWVLLVPREDVVEAQGAWTVSRSASFVAGPPAAGVLVQAVGAPVALVVDAVSYAVSALFVRSVRVDEPPLDESAGESVRRRLVEGFRFLFGQPLLRATLGCATTINFFNFVFHSVVVVFMVRTLHLSPALIGIVLGAGAVGAVVGAALGPRIGRRIGLGRAIVLGSILFPAPLLLFPLAAGPRPLVLAMLFLGEFAAGFGVMVFDIHSNSLSVLVTPLRLRPRQVAAFTTINYGVRPAGALVGGLLGSAVGLREAVLVGAAGACLGIVWLLRSPIPALRDAPAEAT